MPGAEKDADLSFRWQRAPETPHARALALLIGGLGKSLGMNMAWVHPLVEQIDRLAFARTVYAANDYDNKKASSCEEIILCVEQGLPKSRYRALVGRLIDLVPQ